MEFDVIGDIHGQAGKLDALLSKLGYGKRGPLWVPPHGKQAIFVGDLIDRGPEQVRVIDTVRRMVDAGFAMSVMGNHEFNAIGYVTQKRGRDGEFLRKHNPTNVAQHAEFLRQVGEGSALHKELVHWFRTLPPFLDLGGIRVVHAWWHQPHIEAVTTRLARGSAMDDEFLHMAYDKANPEWAAMEGLTKGLEIRLPAGHSFRDHGGVERSEVRTKWWLHDAETYNDVAILPTSHMNTLPDIRLPETYSPQAISGSPVFVGHYWFTGRPVVQTPKVACLDYSAAKDGPLVAYRWCGEASLSSKNFFLSEQH